MSDENRCPAVELPLNYDSDNSDAGIVRLEFLSSKTIAICLHNPERRVVVDAGELANAMSMRPFY